MFSESSRFYAKARHQPQPMRSIPVLQTSRGWQRMRTDFDDCATQIEFVSM